jgi:hypothetical protein
VPTQEYDVFRTAEEVTDQLAAEARALHQAMFDEKGEANVLELFKNSKARPVSLQHLHTVAAVTCCEKTMATPLQFLLAKTDDIGRPVTELLNGATTPTVTERCKPASKACNYKYHKGILERMG